MAEQRELQQRVDALMEERTNLIETKRRQLEQQAGLIGRQQRRINDLLTKSAQAYQVIGRLLTECDKFDSDEGLRALNYFSDEGFDEDFLPWSAREETSHG